MINTAGAILLLIGSASYSYAQGTPSIMDSSDKLYPESKDDLQKIIDPLFRFASEQINKKGTFAPFGAVLKEGKVKLLGAYDNNNDIQAVLHDALRQEAREGARAVATCEWVTIKREGSRKTLAIKVLVEHSKGLTVAFYFPAHKPIFRKWQFDPMFVRPAPVEIGAWYSPPKEDPMSEAAVKRKAEAIQKTPYFKKLQPLHKFIEGKTVADSISGNAGFILILKEGGWAAAFRDKNEINANFGTGKPEATTLSAINSSSYGDASEPLKIDYPHAKERCDIQDEVRKSHHQKLVGLSYGDDPTFDFAFEGNRELGFELIDDSHGRPAVRVFWEQW